MNWEYICERDPSNSSEGMTEWLNSRGQEGWELVSQLHGSDCWVFKRPAKIIDYSIPANSIGMVKDPVPMAGKSVFAPGTPPLIGNRVKYYNPGQALLSRTALSTLFTMEATFQATGCDAQKILPPYAMGSREQRRLSALLIMEEALETIEGLGFMPFAEDPTDRSIRVGIDTIAQIEMVSGDDGVGHAPTNMEKTIDGCCDLIYVATRCLTQMGVPDLPHLAEVCAANDRKFPGGKAIIDQVTGKYLKPEGWVGPDHDRVRRDEGTDLLDLKKVAEELVKASKHS